MKPFYADYVKRSLRFYLRHRKDASIRFSDGVNLKNWESAATAFSSFSDNDRKILSAVYTAKKPFPIAVNDSAERFNAPKRYVWDKVNELERAVAKERGLI